MRDLDGDDGHSASCDNSDDINVTSNTTATMFNDGNCTLTSSSSVYTSSANTSSPQTNSTSITSKGLSIAARTGLSFGILFFFILVSTMLFCYIKRRSRKVRENASHGPALLSSEVRQYRPPNPVLPRTREVPSPPWLDTAHPHPCSILHSSSPSAIPSIDPLLSSRNSHSIPLRNHRSALSQATNIPQTATQRLSTLPNPYDPFPAPARSASITMASSPPDSRPYNASTFGSATMTSAPVAPGGSGLSTSYPQRRPSALHTDLAQYQKELELDHRKRSLDAQEELQEPPPQYSS